MFVDGLKLVFYSWVCRYLKTPMGRLKFKIPVYLDKENHHYHRILPDFMAKYKHYSFDIIDFCIKHPSDQPPESDCDPSKSTIYRWKKTSQTIRDLHPEDIRSDFPKCLLHLITYRQESLDLFPEEIKKRNRKLSTPRR